MVEAAGGTDISRGDRIPVDIGVFAHDEAAGIAGMIATLARQDIFSDPALRARIVILANGCADDTAKRAREAIAHHGLTDRCRVAELARGGKSRTWNHFVHDIARPEADILIFCDADIELPEPDTLRRMVECLSARPELAAINSRAVKDIQHRPAGLSLTERLIAAAGGTLNDWRHAICGQLYALRGSEARAFHLPVGLPVEDGFVRAMVLTRRFGAAEDLTRIDGIDGIYHIYGSERRIRGLIRHQSRIVVGSAVNAALFAHLSSLPPEAVPRALAEAAQDEGWLERMLRARLPARPHGWVPLHFLTKRVANILRHPRGLLRPKGMMVLVAGLGFDLIVYGIAQIRMARGQGAGFW